MPFESRRNSAGRAMSAPFEPAPGCKTSYRRITFAFGSYSQRKRVPVLLRLLLINIRRIDADADNMNAARVEFRKPLLETLQLGVAEQAPKTTIENHHDPL